MLALTAILGVLVAADPVKPPVVGRPLDFSGAIGGPFAVTMRVEPTSVAVEAPFTLSLQIEGSGNLASINRPELGKLGAFAPFAVENAGESFNDGPPMRRTFVYRLRARSAEVLRVPGFKFVYYNPAIANVNHGYQTTIAPSVTIQIRSQEIAASATDDNLAKRVNDLRRGLIADPSSEPLHAELEIARTEVPYPEADMRPSGNRWRYWLPPTWLGAVAVGGCLLGGAALLRWRNVHKPVWFFTGTLGLLLALVSTVGSVVDSRERSRDEISPLIVLKASTELRRGNGPDYPRRIEESLPAGAEVRRLFERGDWLQVELANGIVGWVPRESVFPD